jgi:hypothetical protein
VSGYIIWHVNKSGLRQFKKVSWALSITGMFLATIYLTWYSKDLIALLFLFASFSLAKFRIPFEILPILVYALVFRQYWFLIAALYLMFFFMLRIRKVASSPLLFWAGLTAIAFLILALGYSLVTGAQLSSVRESINIFRLGSIDAKTLIQSFITGSSLLENIANACLVFLSLLVPIPLLLLGSVQYLIAGFFLGYLWISFLKRVKRAASILEPRDHILRIAILVWSMVITLSVFEPDYGSYLRHLTSLLPFVIFVICSEVISDRLVIVPENIR